MTDPAKELRDLCQAIRTKPVPLKDIIPMLQRAADTIDELKNQLNDLCVRH